MSRRPQDSGKPHVANSISFPRVDVGYAMRHSCFFRATANDHWQGPAKWSRFIGGSCYVHLAVCVAHISSIYPDRRCLALPTDLLKSDLAPPWPEPALVGAYSLHRLKLV